MVFGLSLQRLIVLFIFIMVASILLLGLATVGTREQNAVSAGQAIIETTRQREKIQYDEKLENAHLLLADALAQHAVTMHSASDSPTQALKLAVMAVRIVQESADENAEMPPSVEYALWQNMAAREVTTSEATATDLLALMPKQGPASTAWQFVFDNKRSILWNMQHTEPETTARELAMGEERVEPMLVRADSENQWLAVVTIDGINRYDPATPRLWNLTGEVTTEPTYNLMQHQHGIVAADISPNGHWYATADGDHVVRLWYLADGKPHKHRIDLRKDENHGQNGHARSITYITFNPNSRWLATADEVGTIYLWSLEQGRPHKNPVHMQTNGAPVKHLSFLSGGLGWLIAVTERNNRYQEFAWNLNIDYLLQRACSMLPEGITPVDQDIYLPDFKEEIKWCPE